MSIHQFPPIKTERNLEAAQEGFRQLAIAKAERDFELGTVKNGYEAGTVEWAAYDLRIRTLRNAK